MMSVASVMLFFFLCFVRREERGAREGREEKANHVNPSFICTVVL